LTRRPVAQLLTTRAIRANQPDSRIEVHQSPLLDAIPSTPPETAQQINNQADQKNQSESSATVSRTAKIKAAAAKENQQDDDE
jgi:hypothetical protein